MCAILCDPMDCSMPGSSVHGDSPGKNIGVGCCAFYQGMVATPVIIPRPPHIAGGFFTIWATSEAQEYWAYPFSRGSSWPMKQIGVSCIAGGFIGNINLYLKAWLKQLINYANFMKINNMVFSVCVSLYIYKGRKSDWLFSKKNILVPILFLEISLLNSNWMHFSLLLLLVLFFHVNKVRVLIKKQKKMISPQQLKSPGVELCWIKSQCTD